MRRLSWMFCAVLASLLAVSGAAFSAEKAPAAIVEFAQNELMRWGENPVIVKAVKDQNARGMTLEEIQALDERWVKTPGVADFMKPYLENECAQELQKLQSSAPYFAEIFVTDNQGGLVAATGKTSDYWQGDEAKFTECFKGEEGVLYISDVEFDESTQTYSVQISVPVREEGKVIGVIVVGIDVDAFLGE
jgi:C4-dicarboxylate-specific signal transduction histidine kinase